jgi:hypothetical protein
MVERWFADFHACSSWWPLSIEIGQGRPSSTLPCG